MIRIEKRFFLLMLSHIFLGFSIMCPDILAEGLRSGYYMPNTVSIASTVFKFFSCISILIIFFQFGELYRYYSIEKRATETLQQINKQAEQLRELEILRRHVAEQDQLINLVMMANKPDKIPVVMSKLKNDIEKRYLKMEEENLKRGSIFMVLSNFRSQALIDRINFSMKIYANLDNILLSDEQLAMILKELLEAAFKVVLNLDENKRQITLSVSEKLTECMFEIAVPGAENFEVPDDVMEQLEAGNGKIFCEGNSFGFSIGKKGAKGRQLLKRISGGFRANAR